MPELCGFLIAQTFHVAATQAFSVTDADYGTRTVTLPVGYYRIHLAGGGGGIGSGTALVPWELFGKLELLLDPSSFGTWVGALTSAGLASLTCTSTGGGTIDTDDGIWRVLGFSSEVGKVFAQNVAITGTPTHIVQSLSWGTEDKGWQRKAQPTSGAVAPTGRAVTNSNGLVAYVREIALAFHPRDPVVKAADANLVGTPALPYDWYRSAYDNPWREPGIDEPFQDLASYAEQGWTCHHFLATALDNQLAVSDNWQTMAGAYTTCYLDPESIAKATNGASAAGTDKFQTWRGITLHRYDSGGAYS